MIDNRWNRAIALVLLAGLLAGCSKDQPTAPPVDQPTAEPTDQSAGQPTDAAAPAADHKRANELADETSPYLLMHAHNPVNWRPLERGVVGAGPARRQADLFVDRLLQLPLVPRDGT